MNDNTIKCRFCKAKLEHTFVDLGMSPLSNAYVLGGREEFFPLHARVCHKCFLVQLPEYEKPQEIFENYLYFSSYSKSWLNHVKLYVDMIIKKQNLTPNSTIIELASNDGYLLQYFLERDMNILGIEPAKNVAKIAKSKGIPTISKFFSENLAIELSKQNKSADLVIANNVLAHVPNINDFVKGISIILKDKGVATLEFPSLLNLIRYNQFDTIYHEHYSYLSLNVVEKIFKSHGLKLFDAEELPTHGGSLRVYMTKQNRDISVSDTVKILLDKENVYGLNKLDRYIKFSDQTKCTKRSILKKLITIKEKGKKIVGYGAPAKGNTLLNYCGIRDDFLDFVVDLSPHKQGKYLPGTRLAIKSPGEICKTKPDYIFILPWNLKDEIMEQLSYVKEWGCKFIIPIPEMEVVD